MTVGQKIKYIRTLRGLTQKELGKKVGFSSATADTRIRQYELGVMKPKADKLQLIANALDVDISALADLNLTCNEDVMHLFFELERYHGLQIHKSEDNYILSFDPQNETGSDLNCALDVWYQARQQFFPNEAALQDAERIRDYEIWTYRYPLDHNEAKETVIKQIDDLLADTAVLTDPQQYHFETVSDVIRLYERMAKAGLTLLVAAFPEMNELGRLGSRTSILHTELNAMQSVLFAEYIYMTNVLANSGKKVVRDTHSFDGCWYVDFCINDSTLSTAVLGIVRQMLEAMSNKTFETDKFQIRYQDALLQYNVPLSQ